MRIAIYGAGSLGTILGAFIGTAQVAEAVSPCLMYLCPVLGSFTVFVAVQSLHLTVFEPSV